MTDAARIKTLIERHKAIVQLAKRHDPAAGLTVNICAGMQNEESVFTTIETCTFAQELLDLLVKAQVNSLDMNLRIARGDLRVLTEAVKLGEAYYASVTENP